MNSKSFKPLNFANTQSLVEMEKCTVKTIVKFEQKLRFNSDQNFYSILKPSLFCLRFFGSPIGLWRTDKKRSVCRQAIAKSAAFIQLILINIAAIGDVVATMTSVSKPDHKFDDNIPFLFYALGINITGAIALDIIWWRRTILRQLLENIGSVYVTHFHQEQN